MKKILNTLSQKWPEYLLEILVIVIGIYGAFALDNWNENRVNQSKQALYINRLISENTQDIATFDAQIQFLEKGVASVEEFSRALTQQDTDDSLVVSSAYNFFKYGSIAPIFNVSRSTFDDLSSTGNLRLIKNTELRDKLSQYYEYADLVKERLQINNEWSLTQDGPFQVQYSIMKFEPSTATLFTKSSWADLAEELRIHQTEYINNAAVHHWVNNDAIREIKLLKIKTIELIEVLKSSEYN